MSTNGSDSVLNGVNGSAKHTVPIQINGKEVRTEHTFDVANPATGKVLWESSSASKNHAINAIEAAQAAFPTWSKTKPSKRRDILLKAADIIASRAEELGRYMVDETGSVMAYATGFNVPGSVEMLRDVAGRIATVTAYMPVVAGEGKSALVLKEPYGVVLGIAPWNAPYLLGFRAVAYALAGGNTTILKGPELSPRCFWAIGDIFKHAGLPDGCLNVLSVRAQDAAEVVTAMIEHPAVKKINYTGSTAVGSIIASTAGKNLKPVLMELGGKASAIVLGDADIEKAAYGCAEGAFKHSGQICMSTERIIVHSSIAAPFSTALESAIEKLYYSPAPAPILVTSAGAHKNKKLVNQALSKGATLVAGDVNAKEETETRMRPIVVEGVTKEMDLFHEESFGPTTSLMVVDSEEEAIALANDTEYGLSSAVFTEDLASGLRVAKQIESGAVHINGMTVHDEAALPHGGVGKSGFGRFNGSAGLEEFLKLKVVTWMD